MQAVRPAWRSIPYRGRQWVGSSGMLQQVSLPAPSAPHDGGVGGSEGLGVEGGREGGGQGFLALLAQAEASEAVVPSDPGMPGRAAAVDGVAAVASATPIGPEAVDGSLRAGDMAWEDEAGPVAVLPSWANAIFALPTIAQEPAGSAPAITTAALAPTVPGAAIPATDSPALLPQDGVLLSDLPKAASGLVEAGQDTAPAARVAPTTSPQTDDVAEDEGAALTLPSDRELDIVGPAMPDGAAEELKTASASGPESAMGSRTGPTSPSGAGASSLDARGISTPIDMSIPGAASLQGQAVSSASSPSAPPSFAAPYQRLLYPQLSSQVAPAVLAMGLVPGADGGPGRLTVAIRPAELGTLQIVTERMEDGSARIAVLAERPETLQLLVRDAPTLETALRAAGVDDGGGLSLTFGLASQGQGDRGGDARGEAARAGGRGEGADPRPAPIAPAHAMVRTSLLDLSL